LSNGTLHDHAGKLSQIRDPQTYAIIGAAIEVHRVLGCGFLEKVYRVALFEELQASNVPCRAEVSYRIPYKGKPLRVYYRADIVCFDAVIVEVKASVALTRIDQAQAINYLKVSGLHRALLLNFGTRMLQHQRLVLGL
jgi:GxxExxY protein